MNISLKKGKVGITGTYSLMGNENLRTNQLAVTTPGQPVVFTRREVGGSRETETFFQQGNLEFSYDIDSTNTLVVYGNMTRMKNEQLSTHSIYTLFPIGNPNES